MIRAKRAVITTVAGNVRHVIRVWPKGSGQLLALGDASGAERAVIEE